ncbi:hypothetical protein [Stutzerimonas nitrititolerans]|uniref:hypothetical protein n=1 Tax=Stutzerimonas nitrititolerans TaxID=2482751 RepID=UPI0028997E73|nr:hypothetical protein [Stutzerimonas nitrititolerans]
MNNDNESSKQVSSRHQLVGEAREEAEKIVNGYFNNPAAPIAGYRPSVDIVEDVTWNPYTPEHSNWEIIAASLNRRVSGSAFRRATPEERKLLIDTERSLVRLRKRL